MPTVDVEENIKKLRVNIEQLTQEVFRLQGMLQTFEEFKKGGLKTIDLPQDPATQEESTQEKPE
jgi:lipid II:glycine glycyltransferase (peptidoglycan interpeptide bridge formation enzyme)